jgi:hypothetical protein
MRPEAKPLLCSHRLRRGETHQAKPLLCSHRLRRCETYHVVAEPVVAG